MMAKPPTILLCTFAQLYFILFYSGPQIFDWDLDRLKGVVSLGPTNKTSVRIFFSLSTNLSLGIFGKSIRTGT
jgi:hypothetical protein